MVGAGAYLGGKGYGINYTSHKLWNNDKLLFLQIRKQKDLIIKWTIKQKS
jgi:hypothetical protein